MWSSGTVSVFCCLGQGAIPGGDTSLEQGGVWGSSLLVRPRGTSVPVQSCEGERGICHNKSTKYNRTLIYIHIFNQSGKISGLSEDEEEKKERRKEVPERGESNKQACCLKCAGVVCPTGTLTAAVPGGLAV